MEESAFKGHIVWPRLNELDEKLGASESWADQREDHIAHIRWISSSLRSHQDPADTMPYSMTVLNGLDSNLTQINAYMADANSSENLAPLTSSEPYIDSALQQLVSLPPATNREPARQASRNYVEYREAVEKSMTRLNERATEIDNLLGERSTTAAQQNTEADEKFANLKVELDQLQVKITQDEDRLNSALTQNNDSFNTSQTTRETTFTDWLEQKGDDFDTSLDGVKTASQEKLKEIETLHEQVEKVSGKAAGAILARDYGSYSTREWWSGVIAYVLGFAALITLGVYLIHTVSNVSKDEHVSWQYVALKLGLTATAIAAATVAFQFGGHALSRANTNKRVQLELATIGTFLADVDDEAEVQKAKIDFVNRMFGRAWDEKPSTATSSEVVNVSALSKLVDTITKLTR